jgi:hypothetical protein
MEQIRDVAFVMNLGVFEYDGDVDADIGLARTCPCGHVESNTDRF